MFCPEHGSIVHETNKQRAIKALRDPTSWCKECAMRAEAVRNPHPMKAVRDLERSPEEIDREMRFWARKARNNPEKCRLFEKMYGVSPEGYWDGKD